MKKVKIFCLSFLFGLATVITSGIMAVEFADATVVESDLTSAQTVSQEMFGNIQIQSSEYLYGLNDSPDYVYVDFGDSGYAIYYRETMELLEYSPIGSLPYSDNLGKKYYAGPSGYLHKKGDEYVNLSSGENVSLSNFEANKCARQISTGLSQDKAKTVPVLDDDDLIILKRPDANAPGYISNIQYFNANPIYTDNVHGTCGSVATQLLLGYNNYYNNRNIIAPEYLNGGWNNSIGNDDKFNLDNYSFPSRDPNVCVNPKSLTRFTAGVMLLLIGL